MTPDLEQALRANYAAARSAFPWEECARVFAEKRWVYWGSAWQRCGLQGERVPGLDELRAAADDLFEGCVKYWDGRDGEYWQASGRFVVFVRDDGSVEILSEAVTIERYAEVRKHPALSGVLGVECTEVTSQ